MQYRDFEDSFLKDYDPSNFNDYLKLRSRRNGNPNFKNNEDRFLLQVVRKGKLNLEIKNSKYEVKEGYGIIISLFESHRIKVENWDSFDACNLIYPLNKVSNFYKSLQPNEENILQNVSSKESSDLYIKPRIIQITPKIDDLIFNIRNPLKNSILGGKTESILSLKTLLLYILRMNTQPGINDFLDYKPIKSMKYELSLRILKAIDYINQNYDKNLTLDQIAGSISLNKIYFGRFFKNTTGKTPMEYVAQIKVEKAKYFLVNTKLPIYKIGNRLGFSSSSSFSQFFLRMIGCSPKEYREINVY